VYKLLSLLSLSCFWLGLLLELNVIWNCVVHGMMGSGVFFMFGVENEGLWEKHHWYTNQSDEEASNTKTLLETVTP
jgi:hypothetical protein